MELFTPEESRCIADSSFLLTKAEVIRKIDRLLAETRDHLRDICLDQGRSWPSNVDISTGKISRGENYQSLPYMVLDFPCFFSRDDIFSLRTMFWWANFFSCTLHLQGTFLNTWRPLIRRNIDVLSANYLFISVGPTPWEYHYDEDNYARLSQDHLSLVESASFIKLSRRIPLNEVESVKEKTGDFWKLLLSLT